MENVNVNGLNTRVETRMIPRTQKPKKINLLGKRYIVTEKAQERVAFISELLILTVAVLMGYMAIGMVSTLVK